ncbi:hypothetical protein [Rhodococcus tukisamuensis]|uniref:Uncharacterized protein n=1 Tax=Rhodococcus tukisamuensis TaxID=168276 RepID=A0A1G6RI42_9NOCA|nr:hypothetical protein [Rhodococcus tukisamuensis]SDD04292.1 hypothetical protein SAMN05444580_102479 [Rhodococcus tukisamuensis]
MGSIEDVYVAYTYVAGGIDAASSGGLETTLLQLGFSPQSAE